MRVRNKKTNEELKFDINKSYEWDPNIEIVLTGREFEVLITSSRTTTMILNNALEQGVLAGLITESVPPVETEEATVETKVKDIKDSLIELVNKGEIDGGDYGLT